MKERKPSSRNNRTARDTYAADQKAAETPCGATLGLTFGMIALWVDGKLSMHVLMTMLNSDEQSRMQKVAAQK